MVRISLLGAGFVSDFYMQGLREVPGQQVAAVYSQSEERAAVFAKKWNLAKYTTRMEEAIELADLVVIGLPNFVHKKAALAAARAGKAVVCTKPLARKADEARDMLEAVEEAGVMHGYAETEVFSPAVIQVRKLIESGAIGRVLTVRSREAHFGPHAPWFWDPSLAGGGALLDMGCHCIAAARYFFGKDDAPAEVLAWGATLHHKTSAEDNATALLRFSSGGLAVIEVSWTARGGLDLRNEVYGSEGVVFTDVTRGTPVRAFTRASAGYVVEKAEADTGWVFPCVDEAGVYGYREEMRHFVDCVAARTTPRETFADGYVTNVILDAAYRSMQSKQWEKIIIEERYL
ncbi:MAG: Gfo/Idh/MocA family protein, partial [Pseudomonas sp.]